jgi:hypothetical protein
VRCISKVGKRGEFGVRHASLGGGVHLILANPPWRQLQESAEKIPGDKKHMEGMLSRSYYVVQFNTAHKLLAVSTVGRYDRVRKLE